MSATDKGKLREIFLRILRKNRDAVKSPEQIKDKEFRSGWILQLKPQLLKDLGIEPKELEEFFRSKPKETKTVSASVDAILVRFDHEAKETLDRIPETARHKVRKRAIELSKEKGRPYDVRLEDVIEAKEEFRLRL